SGEDAIAFCPDSDYAANVELAEAMPPSAPRAAASQNLRKVSTPGVHTIDEVSASLKVTPEKIVKTLMVVTGDQRECLLLLRGDHMLNETKVSKKFSSAGGFRFASESEIRARLAAGPGSIGPVGADLPVIADRALLAMSDFVCGANEDGYHYTG